jgi:hypothetical protein
MFSDFSSDFTAAIASRFDTDEDVWTTNVEPITDRQSAAFFGNLMVSALQMEQLQANVEAGTLLVWAVIIDDRIYGVGCTVDADGSLKRFQGAFRLMNRHDDTTVAIEEVLDGMIARHATGEYIHA